MKEVICEQEIISTLFHFDHDVNLSEVVSEMSKTGYRPATRKELDILLKMVNLDEYPVVALGIIHKTKIINVFALFLIAYDKKKKLKLRSAVSEWDKACYFLGVRSTEVCKNPFQQ